MGDQRLIQSEAIPGQRTAPAAQEALSKASAAPRFPLAMLQISILVAVMVRPSPRPKPRKRATCNTPVNSDKETALAIRRKYPCLRLPKKSFRTSNAPKAEPENWAANKMPARLSSMCQIVLRVGRMQPSNVVPTPVKANPRCNHRTGGIRSEPSICMNDGVAGLPGWFAFLATTGSIRALGCLGRFTHHQFGFHHDLFAEALGAMKPV